MGTGMYGLKKWGLGVGMILWILLLFPISLIGQERYPGRGIELVIPWAPGGVADITGRIFADVLSKALKVPVTPNNKPGAIGTIGTTYLLSKEKKDGYTLLATTVSNIVLAPVTLGTLPYDTMRDLVPITLITIAPGTIFVKADSPFKAVDAMVDQAKKNPGKLSFGSSGTGGADHFNVEILQDAAKISIRHVPFKGGGEVLPAVMGGHVDVGATTLNTVLPHHKSGTVRILAVTGKKRLGILPEVSTFLEKGYAQDYLSAWVGLFAPAGVPKNVLDSLAEASKAVLNTPDFIQRIEKTGSMVEYFTPAEFKHQIEKETESIKAVAKRLEFKK